MIRKNGQTVDTLELWERTAGPKSIAQWQDDRSAKECARAWLATSGTGNGIPPEILSVLDTSTHFSKIIDWEAEPESQVYIDEYSGPANIDMLVTANDSHGRFAMVIEAKADESFGPLLGEAFTAALERRLANASSKGLARLEDLAVSILPAATGRVPRAQFIRYQLLTATAAAIAHAKSIGTTRAVIMVHEFQTRKTEAAKLGRNSRDLQRYLTRLGVDQPESVLSGRLVGPVKTRGKHTGVSLYFGKALRKYRRGSA